MNEQDRAELQSLKEQQAELLRQVSALAESLRGKEALLDAARRDLQQLRATQSALDEVRRRLDSGIRHLESRLETPAGQTPRPEARQPISTTAAPAHPLPPPIPGTIPPVIPATIPTPARSPIPVAAASPSVPTAQIPHPAHAHAQTAAPSAKLPESRAESQKPPPPPTAAPAPKSSFEMRLGTYWLVRIGIVMLLTGVVFLGTYAYKNFIGHFGPAGKLTLLYLLSGALLALGTWFHRKQESLKNYAQVLFAGGLAAVYFSTYAAYHIPALQVIGSAVVDGALLFAWAAYVVWLADRRKSETLALFAVGLAFYSSVITHVGLFTLYSNLILTIAAVFFLVRNRWATLSFATLAASYGGYAFWRFYHGGEWHWAGPDEGLWKGCYFLISYWALFTAAVFTSKSDQFVGQKRAGFLSLNNASFFTMFLLTMLQVRHGGFWKFALIYGSVLVALAALSWRRLPADKLCANAYLTQGLLLVTIGLITKFSGLKLAVILASESVLLTLANRHLLSRIIQLGAYATAALSVVFAINTMNRFVRADLIIGSFIGAAMIFNAWYSTRKPIAEAAPVSKSSLVSPENLEVVSTILFTVLGLIIWLLTTWTQTHDQSRGLALAIESFAFVVASRPLRNFALRHGALPFAAVAVAWAVYTINRAERSGLWIGLAIGAVVLLDDLISDDEAEAGTARATQKPLFTALALVVWFVTTCVFTPVEHLAPVLAAEGLLFVAVYQLIPSLSLTFGGLAFIFIAQILCLLNLLPRGTTLEFPSWATAKLPWWNPIVVGVISFGITHWARKQQRLSIPPAQINLLQLAYVLPVLGIIFFWLHPHFSSETWLAVTACLAIAVTVYALATRLMVLAIAGQLYIAYSALEFLRVVFFGSAQSKPAWYMALVPAAALVILSFIVVQRLRASATGPKEQWLAPIGLIYRGVAVGLSILWIFRYISEEHFVWVFALAGAACFAATLLIKSRELLAISAVYTAFAFLILWWHFGDPDVIYWPNLLVILALLGQQVIAQRRKDQVQIPNAFHSFVILLGLTTLWFWISKWVSQQAGGFYLTATWAGLALLIFGGGFALKEKVYRWSGLAILTCALCRVVVLDIWRLETIYRILSFMALGIVLLVLGFVYNRFQEKIRQWL